MPPILDHTPVPNGRGRTGAAPSIAGREREPAARVFKNIRFALFKKVESEPERRFI